MSASQITAHLEWIEHEQKWFARCDTPHTRSSGTTLNDALLFLRRKLIRKLQTRDFALVESVVFPYPLQQLADRAKQTAAEYEALTVELARIRTQVLNDTKRYRMKHAHAAQLLGLNPSHLSKIAVKVAVEHSRVVTKQVCGPCAGDGEGKSQ
jgi:hypothetical protein